MIKNTYFCYLILFTFYNIVEVRLFFLLDEIRNKLTIDRLWQIFKYDSIYSQNHLSNCTYLKGRDGSKVFRVIIEKKTSKTNSMKKNPNVIGIFKFLNSRFLLF